VRSFPSTILVIRADTPLYLRLSGSSSSFRNVLFQFFFFGFSSGVGVQELERNFPSLCIQQQGPLGCSYPEWELIISNPPFKKFP